ncbi:MAG: hypothetical protein WD603_02090 [Patescibacteria group bacterium]
MKRDITPKSAKANGAKTGSKRCRAGIDPPFRVDDAFVKRHLVDLLRLTDELQAVYETYPRLQSLVSEEAWSQLTDVPYRQLLELNLRPDDRGLRDAAAGNILRLEDLLTSTLVRDRTAFNDTLTRVLRFRIVNGLATR